MSDPKRLIVGITGASGVIYGVKLLEALKSKPIEIHLIMTPSAEVTLAHEMDLRAIEVRALADVVHSFKDIAASISSGSFSSSGMVIAPCSVRSMSEIATGVTSNLLTRAADVILKERRRLVLMVRETPLHLGHLRTMVTLAELGAIILPPVPAFYFRPQSIEEVIEHTTGRVMDLFNIELGLARRWRQ